jgi:glycosyltransferase involved in cell wall biosynthesis
MIYFYPHTYLRDRQLDTIRYWSNSTVANPEIAKNRMGAQVSKEKATSGKNSQSWKQVIPLLNIKPRPQAAPTESIVYVWGGLIATGSFIVDIDNPWSLVGYNQHAMPIYRLAIEKILMSSRCKEIRCMSEACRKSLKILFGEAVYKKSKVHYPHISFRDNDQESNDDDSSCCFLFVGTQFEIKGGAVLLEACRIVAEACPNVSFRIITHLPSKYQELIKTVPNCSVLSANLSREMVIEQMRQSDVLVHPSLMESFGMVLLEAISCGLAVITTDMYASNEIVISGKNGVIIKPPISPWQGYLPTKNFLVPQLMKNMQLVDFDKFTQDLANAMVKLASDKFLRSSMKKESAAYFKEQFAR